MPTYEVEVIESRAVLCFYEVKARSEKEAVQKAQGGQTEFEMDAGGGEVTDRVVTGVPKLCKKSKGS